MGGRTYCAVLGLGNEEPDDCSLNSAPNGEDDVCLPSDLAHRNGPGELIQHTRSRGSKAGETHALGAHLEGEDFDGVQSLQRGETDGVDGTEDKDEGKTSSSCSLVCAGSCASGNRFLIKRRRNGHGEPNDAASDVGEQEQWATANTIDQVRTKQRPAKLLAVVNEDDIGLSDVASDANGVQDFAHEV